jgi:hypothetical protein
MSGFVVTQELATLDLLSLAVSLTESPPDDTENNGNSRGMSPVQSRPAHVTHGLSCESQDAEVDVSHASSGAHPYRSTAQVCNARAIQNRMQG